MKDAVKKEIEKKEKLLNLKKANLSIYRGKLDLEKLLAEKCLKNINLKKEDRKYSIGGIDIVGKEKKKKLLSLDKDTLRKHINKLASEISMVTECLNFVEGNNILTGEKRKDFLKGISVKKLKNVAPKEVHDSGQDKNKTKKLGSHQKNTGIYLWKEGYEPQKLLGIGSNGVVWECKDSNNNDIAVKVTCDKKLGPFKLVNATKEEINNVKKMESITDIERKYTSYKNKSKNEPEKSKTIDPKKYLAISQQGTKVSKSKQIFESNLAKGDLKSKIKEIQGTKDVNTVIKMGTQVLKALKIIHDAGYSHNDVKPDNLLVVERCSKNLQKNKDAMQEDNKNAMQKNNKNVVQLADFGAMTKINKTSKIFVNSKFSAPDWYKTSPDAVEKRDVYALGAVLLFMLVPNKSEGDAKKMAKYLYSNGPEIFYDKYKLESIYKPGQKSKIINLLITIQLMVADTYSIRLSVDEALDTMQRLKASN